MFNKDSALVKIWLRLLKSQNSKYTINDVPNISNLIEVVAAELNQE